MRSDLRVHAVDEHGVRVSRSRDRAVDVLFDGQRVWSFWVVRDTVGRGLSGRLAPWPEPLTRYLDGRTRVQVRDPATGELHFDDEVAFGAADGRVRVANKQGFELGIDKSGRLVPTFETRDRADIAGLVAATQEVIAALRAAGADPFVAYGTLLGAVREGTVLGHDSDADIGYVSDRAVPVDVIRESFRLQREVDRLGYATIRYSGAAFKVRVVEADSFARGLDVFAGFFDEDRLYLMGEVGVPFRREWIHPLTTASLEGQEVPVPARPEKLLEAMYGPGWKTPDPAFRFTTPASTRTALNDWFRGLRPGFNHWQRHYALHKAPMPRRGPSALARAAARTAAQTGATVLDLGAGKGADALWLARRGVPVVAYDYVPHGLQAMAAAVRDEDLPLEVRQLNLTELRSTLGEGARLARIPGPRIVLAQHLLDATTPVGKQSLVRLCSMAFRDGGTLLAQFFEVPPEHSEWGRRVEVPELLDQLEQAGAKDVKVTWHRRERRGDVCRIVGEW